MTKKIIISIILILATFAAALVAWGNLREKELMREGTNIVQRVEQFRLDNGRLPKNLLETGLLESEEGPLYYEKRGDEHYVIFFSVGFDDLWGYYSDSKKWENHYRQ